MNWYFIRHGEIASNRKKIYSGRSDEALTESGRAQVEQACEQIGGIHFDAIMCSPLTRTMQTAEIIADSYPREIPVHVSECFNELKMGPWEGMAEDEVARLYPEEWSIWNKSPADLALAGRETLAQLRQRVLDGMSAIEREYDYGSVLAVTHVAIIRVVLLKMSKLTLNQYKTVKVGNAEVFDIQNLPPVNA